MASERKVLGNIDHTVGRILKRPNLRSRLTHSKAKKNRPSITRHHYCDYGYTVDIADLLFTPERDYLIKNNRPEVKVDDLKDKAIVLFIFPLNSDYLGLAYNTLDMIEAYNELSALGGVEFVFVPSNQVEEDDDYYGSTFPNARFESEEALFSHLLSTLPFPAIPFADVAACGDRVVKTFSVDDEGLDCFHLPYRVVIDPTSTVVATRSNYPDLFKLFGGAELHPLSQEKIDSLIDEHEGNIYGDGLGNRRESRRQLISKWDQLLESPTRDFLVSSNGDRVPVSSLKGKVIGLYFCENIPHPPRMKLIKKIYQEAKLRGYAFEIVQINFQYPFYPCIEARDISAEDMLVHQCSETVSWLTLPFKDPSCRKLQRIFECSDFDEDYVSWCGDCLVIIDSRQTYSNRVRFEFSGGRILKRYGIEGFPFTRPSLFEAEYMLQKRELRLQWFFPPGLCLRRRWSSGGGFDLVKASKLSGKRVLLLFAEALEYKPGGKFVAMLESEYLAQQLRGNAGKEDKFEVVFICTDMDGSRFGELTKDMPWLVYPYSYAFGSSCIAKAFPVYLGVAAAAFGRVGELIAKEWSLNETWGHKEDHKQEFPFLSRDMDLQIRKEVRRRCHLDDYYRYLPDEEF